MRTAEHTFNDVEDFTERVRAMGWQGEVAQSETGRFQVDLAVHQAPGLISTRTRHNVANVRQINTPANARTFGLVVPERDGNSWCQHNFDQVVVQMMPRSDYTAANPAGHLGYQLAFDDDRVAQVCEQLGVDTALTNDACLFELAESRGPRVLQLLDNLFAVDCDLAQVQAADSLLTMFISAFNSGYSGKAHARASQRHAAFRNAKDYMHAHLDEAITLADISRQANASRRTLTNAFQESLGMAPMTYLKLLRLNRVQQVLRRASLRAPRISDVANDHGFWHMGQFASDYRQLFGELPSQTLANASVL